MCKTLDKHASFRTFASTTFIQAQWLLGVMTTVFNVLHV